MAAIIAGALLTRFYKEVADNIGSGVASYERYRLVGVLVCVAGVIMMFNFHNLVFGFIAYMIFGDRIGH